MEPIAPPPTPDELREPPLEPLEPTDPNAPRDRVEDMLAGRVDRSDIDVRAFLLDPPPTSEELERLERRRRLVRRGSVAGAVLVTLVLVVPVPQGGDDRSTPQSTAPVTGLDDPVDGATPRASTAAEQAIRLDAPTPEPAPRPGRPARRPSSPSSPSSPMSPMSPTPRTTPSTTSGATTRPAAPRPAAPAASPAPTPSTSPTPSTTPATSATPATAPAPSRPPTSPARPTDPLVAPVL